MHGRRDLAEEAFNRTQEKTLLKRLVPRNYRRELIMDRHTATCSWYYGKLLMGIMPVEGQEIGSSMKQGLQKTGLKM